MYQASRNISNNIVLSTKKKLLRESSVEISIGGYLPALPGWLVLLKVKLQRKSKKLEMEY